MGNNDKYINPLSLKSEDSPEIDICNGCAVCVLSCPVYGQTSDILKTFCGRMRLTQGGATSEDLKHSANACILCGSCEPVCSYGMDTVARTLELRANISGTDSSKDASTDLRKTPSASGKIFLANSLLMESDECLQKVLLAIGNDFKDFADNGEDISDALETGEGVSPERVQEFVSALDSAQEIITSDGLLYRLLKRFTRQAKVMGIGEALLTNTRLPAMLKEDDLYIIDSRTYNSDFERLVTLYDNLRQQTGCMMNLDLHRVATPTGASRIDHANSVVDPQKQVKWILEGRPAKRIIVERLEDIEPFVIGSDIPVIFVSELL
jgi:ferredoxin